jgi:hypothetical protein
LFEDCETVPVYNYPTETKGLFCAHHKHDDMIDIITRICAFESCDKQPSFNFQKGDPRLYCKTHKLEGMIDVSHNYCKVCQSVSENPKYDGHCARCYSYIYPDREISKNFKSKERSVVEFIKQNYSNLEWEFDKRVKNGSSLRRPDVLLQLKNQVLIIEIDENQHQKYDCSCDNKRLVQLLLDINPHIKENEINKELEEDKKEDSKISSNKHLVFIRFNPDKYYDKNNKKIDSCWTENNTKLEINSKKKWNERLETLKYWIDYWIENETNKTIEIVELFYDQNLIN